MGTGETVNTKTITINLSISSSCKIWFAINIVLPLQDQVNKITYYSPSSEFLFENQQ